MVYFRENTGINLRKNHKRDFFTIAFRGIDDREKKGVVKIYFYDTKDDAINDAVEKSVRTIYVDLKQGQTQPEINEILNFENIETTSLDQISLSGATKIE